MDKNYKAVNDYYHSNHIYEFMMCHYLNKNMPIFMIKSGLFFEIQADSQYNKHDINLVKITPKRDDKKIIAKIEYEYAATQNVWDFELPRDKW